MKRYDGVKYRPAGFFDEETPEQKADIFNKIETVIDVYYKDLLYKNEKQECTVFYENQERNGIIMAHSSLGKYKVGVLKDDEHYTKTQSCHKRK